MRFIIPARHSAPCPVDRLCQCHGVHLLPCLSLARRPVRSSQPALIRRPRLCRRHSESASLRTVRLYALPFLPAAIAAPGACAKRFSCRASDAQFFSPAFGKHFREGIPVSRQQTAPLYRRSRFENPASRRMQRVCPGNANQFSLRRIRRRRDRAAAYRASSPWQILRIHAAKATLVSKNKRGGEFLPRRAAVTVAL